MLSSAFRLNGHDFLNAASRFYFVYPIFFSALVCINIFSLKRAAQLYILIVSFAACCLIYQVYFGPIPYFVDDSNRAGVPRYATFLGALPTFGVAGAFALLSIGFAIRHRFIFGALFFVIFTGLILTLQKAALANLVIILFFMFWLAWKNKLCVGPAKLSLIFLVSSFANFFFMNDYVLVNIDFLGFKLPRFNGELIGWTGYGVIEDASMRVTNHFLQSHSAASATTQIAISATTQIAISATTRTSEFLNFSSTFFGVGYEALGGALGLDRYPMSHNGLVDIWRLGGAPYMTVFCLLSLSIARGLKCLNSGDGFSWYAPAFFALFSLNFIFYTGIFVNPAIAILFWINLAYLSVRQDVS
jgi:hypothetical protein